MRHHKIKKKKKDIGLRWSRISEVLVVPSVNPLAAGLWKFGWVGGGEMKEVSRRGF